MPATLNLWAIPTTLLWALCAVPNASLTYTSPNCDNWFLNSFTASGSALIFFPESSFCDPYSSMWKRTFSQRKTSFLALLTLSMTLFPTQSSRKVTGRLRYDVRWSRTGLRECLLFLFPLGRPKCERRTRDFGVCWRRASMVGIVASINE